MQEVFWHLGSGILNLAYKGAIYDESVVLGKSTSENDNIDVFHETANKLNITRLILRPQINDSLKNALGDYCVGALKDVMVTFLPAKGSGKSKPGDVPQELKVDAKMDWLKKFLPVEVAMCPPG